MTSKRNFTEILQDRIESDPDLTVAGVASRAGIDNSTIRIMIARNTSPREATMRKIAKVFGETLEQFMQHDLSEEERKVLGLMQTLSLAERRQLLGYAESLRDKPDSFPDLD